MRKPSWKKSHQMDPFQDPFFGQFGTHLAILSRRLSIKTGYFESFCSFKRFTSLILIQCIPQLMWNSIQRFLITPNSFQAKTQLSNFFHLHYFWTQSEKGLNSSTCIRIDSKDSRKFSAFLCRKKQKKIDKFLDLSMM